MTLLSVMYSVMFPVAVMAALGAAIGRRVGLASGPVSGLVFYLFSPALVFDRLLNLDFAAVPAARIIAVVTIGFLALAVVAFGVSTFRVRRDRSTTSAVALCSSMGNMGNMGLPVSLLAFGEEGLDVAVLAFMTGSVLAYSGGVVIASLGAGSRARAWSALLRVPAVWVIAPALAWNVAGVPPPAVIGHVTSSLAEAAIPLMLVVLGLQFVQRTTSHRGFADLMDSVGLRLIGGPVIAGLATAAVGLGGTAQHALVVLGGMPTAVAATVVAGQFGLEPQLVSRAVVVSTVLSLGTLTALIAAIG